MLVAIADERRTSVASLGLEDSRRDSTITQHTEGEESTTETHPNIV